MSIWDDRIRDHRIWAEMTNTGVAVDETLKKRKVSPESISAVERVRSILSYLGKRMASADPLLTAPQTLENIASNLTNVRTELQSYTSDGQPGHLTNANAHADQVLTLSAPLPSIESPEELAQIVRDSVSYRVWVEKASSETRDSYKQSVAEAEAFKKEVTEVRASLETEKLKISQLASQHQAQFSTAQEARSKNFADVLAAAQKNLLQLQTDYQAQFSSGQEARGKEFLEAQGSRLAKFEEMLTRQQEKIAREDQEFLDTRSRIIEQATSRLQTFQEETERDADAIIRRMTEAKEHVEKLVGVIGNLGVTSGYLRTANSSKQTMWFWQGLTLIALGVLSFLAYRTLPLIEDSKGAINWIGFAGRVLLLVSLGVIAAYSGTQADKLFTDERRNRKLALELEAIGPYLAPLPEEEQNKFRLMIGSRSFGRSIDSLAEKHKKSPVSAIDLLNRKEVRDLLQALLDLSKKAKD